MKLIFKLGLLYRINIWDNNNVILSDKSFFIEMDDDGKSLGIKPEGEKSPAPWSAYHDREYCTSQQLQALLKKLIKIRKQL